MPPATRRNRRKNPHVALVRPLRRNHRWREVPHASWRSPFHPVLVGTVDALRRNRGQFVAGNGACDRDGSKNVGPHQRECDPTSSPDLAMPALRGGNCLVRAFGQFDHLGAQRFVLEHRGQPPKMHRGVRGRLGLPVTMGSPDVPEPIAVPNGCRHPTDRGDMRGAFWRVRMWRRRRQAMRCHVPGHPSYHRLALGTEDLAMPPHGHIGTEGPRRIIPVATFVERTPRRGTRKRSEHMCAAQLPIGRVEPRLQPFLWSPT